MEKILISACLVGDKTKYDGKSNYNPKIKDLLEKYELVPFCPEVEGGLPIPRIPGEIIKDKVIGKNGRDLTYYYNTGAKKALLICQYLNIKMAILKEHSPSCGVHQIYDGSFTGKKIIGQGVTSKLLKEKGIEVFSEEEIDSLL